MNFKMFDRLSYNEVVNNLYQNQLKTLCYSSFLYMLLGGFSYHSLLYSYFALIIFSFIQKYGLSYVKNYINNSFKKLFHKFITNKTLREVSMDGNMDEVDEVSADEVNEDSADEVNEDSADGNVDKVSVDGNADGNVDEVSADGNVDEVSADGNADEVSTDEVSTDEVSVGDIERSSYNLRNRHPLSGALH